MIAYKGFNKNLICTMGKGKYQFQMGVKVKENRAKCANNGFHCCEYPLDCLRYYSNSTDRYCIVLAEGDINEDGDHRISCTELTPLKEISIIQLAAHACNFIVRHPDREYYGIEHDKGCPSSDDEYVIVRGKNPEAKGKVGDTLFLLQEYKTTKSIKNVSVISVDGKKFKADTYYGVKDVVA